MTVQEAISTFRIKLGAASFDDDGLSDQAIFKLLSDSVAIVFTRYKDKWYKVSDWLWSTYGIELEMIGSDQFLCEDIDHCVVLQSVNRIPEPLMGRHKPMFKVYNGTEELPEYNSSNQFDDYLKTKPSWELVNGKLRIHNNKTLKAITVKTIAFNFLEWFDIQYCDHSYNSDCYDLSNIQWPLFSDAKMQGMATDMALQSLGLTLNQIQQQPNQNDAH